MLAEQVGVQGLQRLEAHAAVFTRKPFSKMVDAYVVIQVDFCFCTVLAGLTSVSEPLVSQLLVLLHLRFS